MNNVNVYFSAARMSMYRPHWPPSAFDQAHLHQHPDGVQQHHQQLQQQHQSSWNSSRIQLTPPPPPPSSAYSSALPPTPPKDMSSQHEGQPSSSLSPSSISPPLIVNTKQEFPNHHQQHHVDEQRSGMGSREVKTPPSTTSYYHPDMNPSPGASGGFNSFTPNSGVCGGQRQSIDSPNDNNPYSSSQSNSRSKSSKNRPNAGKCELLNKNCQIATKF